MVDRNFKQMVLKFMIAARPKDKRKILKNSNFYLFNSFERFFSLMEQDIAGPNTLVNLQKSIKNYVKKKKKTNEFPNTIF